MNCSSGACFGGCDSTPCLHFPPSSGSAVPPQCCFPETPTARSSLSSHLSSLSRLRKIMEGRKADTGRKYVIPTAVCHFEGHSRESYPLPANLELSLVLWNPLNEGLIFPASHYFLKRPREWLSSARRKTKVRGTVKLSASTCWQWEWNMGMEDHMLNVSLKYLVCLKKQYDKKRALSAQLSPHPKSLFHYKEKTCTHCTANTHLAVSAAVGHTQPLFLLWHYQDTQL